MTGESRLGRAYVVEAAGDAGLAQCAASDGVIVSFE